MRQIFFLILLFLNLYANSQSAYSLYNDAKALKSDGKNSKAIKTFEEALEKFEKSDNTEMQMNCHLELAELKDNVINYKEALSHYEAFSKLYRKSRDDESKALTDSVVGLKTEVEAGIETIKLKDNAIDSLTTKQLQDQLAIKDLELENEKHNLELQESANKRNILLWALAMFVVLAIFITRGYVTKRKGVVELRKKNYQIVREKQQSERLLLNILPAKIAAELKEFNKTTPAKHEQATIMFTDFKGFTLFSQERTPEDVVEVIDHYFSAFDKIIEKHGIEKIKTIGDAYMCVSGIPESNPNHIVNMIHAAQEIRDFVNKAESGHKESGKPYLQMRIGIHTGPLVAGVVGSRKFAYDVWGDAVNIAARMEQSGEPGQINVSETVYEGAKNEFEFEFRGEVKAKNKGMMKMYFVKENNI